MLASMCLPHLICMHTHTHMSLGMQIHDGCNEYDIISLLNSLQKIVSMELPKSYILTICITNGKHAALWSHLRRENTRMSINIAIIYLVLRGLPYLFLVAFVFDQSSSFRVYVFHYFQYFN